MEETYYQFDKKEFSRLTKKFCKKKKSWKMLNLLSWLFVAGGIAPIVIMSIAAADPTVPPGDAVYTMIMVGIAMSCLPFCLAYVTKNQTIRHLGKPYSVMRNMFLYTNKSGIQFAYHDRYHKKWPANTMCDQIAYENIHHVEVDQAQQLFTVVGRTERVEYINMQTNRIGFEFTNGQFGDMASFSFFLCFENEQKFFDILKEKGIEIRKV